MYFFLKSFSFLVSILPFKASFARVLGSLLWLLLPSKRKALAISNLTRSLALPLDKAKHLAEQSAILLAETFFEVLSLPIIIPAMRRIVSLHGFEHILEYKAKSGRGGIIMTCHSDNWELMGGAFAQNGIKLVGVAKKQKSSGADKFINEMRELLGMEIRYREQVRELYRLLDEGHFIGLIMDQDIGREDGVVVKFFNQATNFASGAASMSRFRKVPIFPAFMHRNADGTHTLEISEPLMTERTGDKRADIKKMTQRLARLIEEHVRKYPAEWFWLHDRWKSMREEYTAEEVARLEKELGIDNNSADNAAKCAGG